MLINKARIAVLWTSLEAAFVTVTNFLISVVLARMLVPEDFGTVAILGVFVSLANLFVNAGLGMALVQRQDITHADESTVFWFNLMAALIMMIILIAAAPRIAGYFDIPILENLSMVLAANVALSSLGTTQGTLFTKRLDFKTPMKIGVVSALVAGSVGILMAWNNFGVWALAGQIISSTLVSVMLLWCISPWRPLMVFDKNSFKKLFSYGVWLFFSGILDALYQRSASLIIGKLYGRHDLGIYSRADNIQSLAAGVISNVLARVSFPLFSSVNDDKYRLRRGLQMVVQILMFVTIPAMTGLALLAEPFIRLIYGENWLGVVPILQILAFSGLLFPLQVVNLSVLQAQGHSKLFFRLEVAKKVIGIFLLIYGSMHGLIGLAIATGVGSAVSLLINAYYTKKHLDYGAFSQIKDCAGSFFNVCVMSCTILLLKSNLGVINWWSFAALVMFGAIVYLSLSMLMKSSSYVLVKNIIMRRE